MSALDLYIILKLNCIRNFAGTAGVLTLIASIVLIVICAIVASDCVYNGSAKDVFKEWFRFLRTKVFVIVSIFCLLLSVLLPTTKQAAFLYIAPHIINNGEVQEAVKILPEIVKLGTDYLKEIVKGENNNDTKQD